MKSIVLTFLILILGVATATSALAAGPARVRVVRASPDAPDLDVWVNDSIIAFTNAPFKGVTKYAALDPATYDVKVIPTRATEPVVIEANGRLAGSGRVAQGAPGATRPAGRSRPSRLVAGLA